MKGTGRAQPHGTPHRLDSSWRRDGGLGAGHSDGTHYQVEMTIDGAGMTVVGGGMTVG